ncbi:hypothetical protein FRC15_000011 [Serendipita sp. 397]|nr:hypothetical protein FRC15_000011 [Serendipita sp. 397]
MTSLLARTLQNTCRSFFWHTNVQTSSRIASKVPITHTSQSLQTFWNPAGARTFFSSPLALLKRKKKYKLKTNHAAANRWKALAKHQFKRSREGKAHGNVSKSPARMNRLGMDAFAKPYHKRHLKKLLPYA